MSSNQSHNKIFGIGLSKTGTTSLDAALWHLGFRSIHYPDAGRILGGDFSEIAGKDAATDIPVAGFFKELDTVFPGSKFVLTVRDAEGWLKSIERHFAKMPTSNEHGAAGAMRTRVYGQPTFEASAFLSAYRAHIVDVASYFANRQQDLLVLNPVGGEGWEKLAPFLDKPIPSFDFPHVNQSGGSAEGVGYPPEALRVDGPIKIQIGRG